MVPPASSLPGLWEFVLHRHIVPALYVHRCPGLSRNAPCFVCVCSTTTHFLLKGHVGSDYSQTQSMCVCVENLCCSVTISPSLPPSLLSIPFLPLYLSLAISCSLDQFCNYPMCEYDSSKSLCVYASVFTSLSPTSLSLSLFHTLSLHPFSPSISL